MTSEDFQTRFEHFVFILYFSLALFVVVGFEVIIVVLLELVVGVVGTHVDVFLHLLRVHLVVLVDGQDLPFYAGCQVDAVVLRDGKSVHLASQITCFVELF